MQKIRPLMIATLLATASTLAMAHSDKAHAKKSETVKKEQKEWGMAGDAKAVTRTIKLNMSDNMRFTPDQINVK